MNGNAISMMNYRYLISDKIRKSQKSWQYFNPLNPHQLFDADLEI